MMAHTGIAMMIEAAETMVEAVGREYLVMGTIGMMTIEDAKTTMKIDMTHTMIGHGAPEMIILSMIMGMMVEVPPQTQNDSKASGYPKGQ